MVKTLQRIVAVRRLSKSGFQCFSSLRIAVVHRSSPPPIVRQFDNVPPRNDLLSRTQRRRYFPAERLNIQNIPSHWFNVLTNESAVLTLIYAPRERNPYLFYDLLMYKVSTSSSRGASIDNRNRKKSSAHVNRIEATDALCTLAYLSINGILGRGGLMSDCSPRRPASGVYL